MTSEDIQWHSMKIQWHHSHSFNIHWHKGQYLIDSINFNISSSLHIQCHIVQEELVPLLQNCPKLQWHINIFNCIRIGKYTFLDLRTQNEHYKISFLISHLFLAMCISCISLSVWIKAINSLACFFLCSLNFSVCILSIKL